LGIIEVFLGEKLFVKYVVQNLGERRSKTKMEAIDQYGFVILTMKKG